MSYLIVGGTGTVGSGVVRGLLERGEGVRVLTRSEAKVASLPEGAEGVVGDLRDPGTFGPIFDGMERMFLLNAVAPTELQEGLSALAEARRAGTERIVYLSVQDVEKGPHIPHFASKIAIETALRTSGVPYTILRPNNYYQNDHWYRDVIVGHGVYPQPLGAVGVSRVDVRDIARAAVNALTRTDHENRTFALAGPEALTGEDCARVYSAALDREIRYGGSDLDAWQRQALQMLPAWMVYDFRLMYRMFQERGLAATDEQREETRTLVGDEPRGFGEFVEETVAAW